MIMYTTPQKYKKPKQMLQIEYYHFIFSQAITSLIDYLTNIYFIDIVLTNILLKVISPPGLGLILKYLLQKSSDASKIGQIEPMNIPKAIPVPLHVDA